jgi:LacI family transcriptional regulator of maltose regulon
MTSKTPKIKITDVAAYADVSVSTVSLVLSNKGAMAQQAGIPAVCLARAAMNNEVDYIGPDNHQAAVLATQHFIEQGHRHIAYIGGSGESLTRAERLGGFGSTLIQYGLPFKNEWIIETNNQQQHAATTVQQLLTQHPKITAILCHSPTVALGAIYGVKRSGKSVGKDNYIDQQVAIISFDDIAEATLIQPSLTVVSSPVREIGQQAGKRLLSKMNNNNNDIQRLILAPQLICRDSA